MTLLGWLYSSCVAFILSCWALTWLLRRRIRFQRAHRRSVHFPLSHFQCADLVGDPASSSSHVTPPNYEWCTDCGWHWQHGHAAECPRVTGERCPRCEKPKRTAHVCHYCGFAGFVIVFDLKRIAATTHAPVNEKSERRNS